MERIKVAPASDLANLIRVRIEEAYGDVFRRIDPATATDAQIADAFRQYEPPLQRARMVALFRGLCALAGILPPERRPAGGQRPQRATSLPSAKPGTSVLRGLVDVLPTSGRWTTTERDRWLTAFTAALDVLIVATEHDRG
jgi:hypothetical protein